MSYSLVIGSSLGLRYFIIIMMIIIMIIIIVIVIADPSVLTKQVLNSINFNFVSE